MAWGAKYVLDDDVIRYVSIENFKYKDQEVATHPEPDADNVVSILVHTTVPFGLAHKDVLRGCGAESRADLAQPPHPDPDTQQKQKQAVIEAILRSVVKGQVLPALSAYAPAQVQLVGWEQSQVTRSYHHAGRGTVGDLDTSRGVLSSNGQAANERSELIAAAPSALVLSVGADGVATLIPGGSSATFAASDGDGKSAAAAASESVQSVPRMPLLVLAGDAFTESNFDGCIKSAHFAAQAVAKHILGR